MSSRTPMSLRQRFVLIVSLAVVALVTAAFGLVQLRAETQAARESAAVEQCDAAVVALLHSVSEGGIETSDASESLTKDKLQSYASSVAAPLGGVAAGYCNPDASLLVHGEANSDDNSHRSSESRPGHPLGPPWNRDARHPPPKGEAPPPPPPDELGPQRGPPPDFDPEHAPPDFDRDHVPPDVRSAGPVDAPPFGRPFDDSRGPAFRHALGEHLPAPDLDMIFNACRDPSAFHTDHQRVRYGNEVVLLSVRSAKPNELAAWSLIRVPATPTEGGFGWSVKFGIMALATFLLVGLTIDALLVLQRGADDLGRGLAELKDDLRAPIPEPRARELAEIAKGLRTMARHLAEAQERERALSNELGHEQRLAGLGRVVAGVAHEVRNPLAGIKLKLDQMARRRPDERSSADIAICLQEIARLDRVVSSLLWVARKGPVEKEKVDLAELARERALAAGGVAGTHEVTIATSGAASAPANREEMTRVLDNLLRNAVEASPKASEVYVGVDEDEAAARITIEDNGTGIPTERLQELFEPFFTLKPDGTGLGLFLSKALIEAHEGTLSYERTEGRTRFTISLPKGSVDADTAEHSHR